MLMGLLEEQSDWTHLVGVICICVGGARHVMGPGVMGAGDCVLFRAALLGGKCNVLEGVGMSFFQKRVRELRRVESCRSAEGRRGLRVLVCWLMNTVLSSLSRWRRKLFAFRVCFCFTPTVVSVVCWKGGLRVWMVQLTG